MIRTTLLLTLCTVCAVRAAEPGLTKGFVYFYNLEYDQALSEFRREAADTPADPYLQNHIAQTILFREMFRDGALESEMVTGNNPFLRRANLNPTKEEQRTFQEAIDRAMQLSKSRVDKDPTDLEALYALGVTYSMRADYNWLVKKAWLDALRDATAARKYHGKVTELDPSFTDAELIQGVHEYLVGSLPWHYRILGVLGGMHGDREGGRRRLERVASKGLANRYDAQIILAAIYRRERQPEKAIPLLLELSERFPGNFLLRLELMHMYADAGQKEPALAILNKLEQEKRANAPELKQLPLEKICYFRGNLLFWYRDWDAALPDLRKASANTADLDANSAAYAWLRMAEVLDMKGQRKDAQEAYRQVMAQFPKSDPAGDAKQYLKRPYVRTGS